MPKNKPQWRHHYVPEFYLKRWQIGDDRLVEYSRPRGRTVSYRWVSPKQTGYTNKLYFLSHLPENQRNAYEDQFFKPVDTKAATVLNKMEAGIFRFTSAERSSWARFVMSLMFRSPESLNAVRERLEKEVYEPDEEDERDYRRRRRPHEPKTLREALGEERDVNYLNQTALDVTRGLADSRRIGQHFINMNWGYRKLPFDVPVLLTSDRPIMWALEMVNPDCHIMIPTGPKSFFWATNSLKMIGIIERSNPHDLVKFLNDHVTRHAVKYVWGPSQHHLTYVQRFMGVDPAETIPDKLIQQRWEEVQQAELEEKTSRRGRNRRRS